MFSKIHLSQHSFAEDWRIQSPDWGQCRRRREEREREREREAATFTIIAPGPFGSGGIRVHACAHNSGFGAISAGGTEERRRGGLAKLLLNFS